VNAVDAGALIALASATAHAGHRPPALDAEPHSIIAPRVH
jgi:hypothetical protein